MCKQKLNVVKDNNVVPSKLNDLVKNKKTIRRYKGKKENIIIIPDLKPKKKKYC